MPLDIKTFRVRAITALVFVAIMCVGLFVNWWTFALLFGIIMMGAIAEFNKIIRLIYGNSARLPFAIFYIVIPIVLLLDMGTENSLCSSMPFRYNPILPCTLIFSIWINDTMAYLVGSFIGRTPFSAISPKKTWEGTLGGALLCITIISGSSRLFAFTQNMPVELFIGISAIAAVFGTLGDLLESKLKRMAGIKDSGAILPGHGGFLDRFDSLIVAAPFVWLFLHFYK